MRAKRRFAALGTVGHLIKASEGNLNDQRSDERHLNGQCSEAAASAGDLYPQPGIQEEKRLIPESGLVFGASHRMGTNRSLNSKLSLMFPLYSCTAPPRSCTSASASTPRNIAP